MNIIRRLIWWVIDCWRIIMDNRYNPLRHIADPSIQSYFTLALFIMWSGYFAHYSMDMDWLGVLLNRVVDMVTHGCSNSNHDY